MISLCALDWPWSIFAPMDEMNPPEDFVNDLAEIAAGGPLALGPEEQLRLARQKLARLASEKHTALLEGRPDAAADINREITETEHRIRMYESRN